MRGFVFLILKRVKMKLSANHKRILSVTVRKTEDTLIQIENILVGKNKSKISEKIIPHFTEKEKERILKILEELHKRNRKLIEKFSLEPLTLYEERLIAAHVAFLWTILTDSKSKKLGKYGKLNDDVGKELDKEMEELISLTNELNKIIQHT